MRVVLGMGVLALCVVGCGGGASDEGPGPVLPRPESLFSGEYAYSMIGGYQLFGAFGWTAWADATADGRGTWSYTVTANELGVLSPTHTSTDLGYTIASDRSVRWRPGSDHEWRGGVSADGAVLGQATHGDATRPIMGIFVRRGSGLGPTDLLGTYHYAGYGFPLPALPNESRWGSATFDGVSAGSVTWRANTDGSVAAIWVLETLGYDVSPDGTLDLTVTGRGPLTGAVLGGGELAVLSGETVETMPSSIMVFLATTTGATSSLLDGTYFVVGIELDRSTQSPANRVYSGTVRADGVGGLEPDLTVKQEEDPVSGYSPVWSGYTVGADGALEVTTPAGERWVGGVSPSGRFAVFAGDAALGGDPVLFFLYR